VISEAKRILQLALPMVVTQILWMTMPIVDNMMVGKLGPVSLAAMAIATTYYWLLQLVCFGILTALNPMVSHAFGAGRTSELRSLFQSALCLSLILSVSMISLLAEGESVLILMKQDPLLLNVAQKYLNQISWGVPFHLGFIVCRQFCDALENPRPTIVFVFCAAVLNAILDYALIYGNFGLQAMGVAGAGLATSLAQVFLCLAMLGYVGWWSRYRIFELFKKVEIKKQNLVEMLKIGVPSSGAMLAEMIYFSGSTLIMGLLGTVPVAAHQIALNVASATFMIPLGLSIAVAVRVGGFMGKRDWTGVKRAGNMGFLICLALGTLNATFLLVFSEQIVRLYNSDSEVVQLARTLVKIAGVFQIFDGLQVVGIYALRGLKDTRIPFLNTLISFALVGMTLSILLSFYWQQGPVGFWLGMIASFALAASLHQWRFRKLISV